MSPFRFIGTDNGKTAWLQCRQRALEAIQKHSRTDLTWEIYS